MIFWIGVVLLMIGVLQLIGTGVLAQKGEDKASSILIMLMTALIVTASSIYLICHNCSPVI